MQQHIIDPPQIRVLKSQQERITKLMTRVGAELVAVGRELRDQGDAAPIQLKARRAVLTMQGDELRAIRLELHNRILDEQRRQRLPL